MGFPASFRTAMLIWFVIVYWVISVGIGLWTALHMRNTADSAAAGRSLSFYIATATVLAIWFSSEAVFGIPAEFLKDGLHGVVTDPFGLSLCLVLVGLFFAKPLYRVSLLTIGDFYRNHFGRIAETLTTLCIVISYLGWVAAQIKALGLVFYTVPDDAVSQDLEMMISTGSVLVYTLLGGMWSMAVTDLIQMIIIVIGMLYIGREVSDQAGGVGTMVTHTVASSKFSFWPAFNPIEAIGFVTARITMMLGSIPQQDVFRRVTSPRTEHIAGTASMLGGVLHSVFAFMPMFLAYSVTLIDPEMVAKYIDTDSQMILPNLMLQHTSIFAQMVFFGTLLSAVKSYVSATLLAPSVTFAENVLRPLPPNMDDKRFLRMMQAVVLMFTILMTLFALNSHLSIFRMVESAYRVTLVAAFVPLIFGSFWRRATRQGGLLVIILGLATWIRCKAFQPNAMLPPQLVGLLVSFDAMILGSLGPQWITNRTSTTKVVMRA